jgi:hypothetical protein
MSNSGKPFTTVKFEDATVAVVRTDPSKPRLLEVIAIFSDASRGRDYAEAENKCSGEQPKTAPTAAPAQRVIEPTGASPELSARQKAVLEALRAKMDKHKLAEVKAAVLAEAAKIPLGSLHSTLQSLEKKQRTRTTRAGSARAPAVYQVL